MKPPMPIIVRGFVGGHVVFTERYADLPADETMTALAVRHTRELLELAEDGLYHIEIEVPELPENERYIRMGTDTRNMVDPVAVLRR